jgi:hypothetical protein
MKLALLAAGLASLLAASGMDGVDPKIGAAAKEWFHRFQTGNIDRSQLDAEVNRELTDASIKKEEATLKPFGEPTGFEFIGSQQIKGADGYVFLITFRAGRIAEAIAFDKQGKIAGIDFQTFVPNSGVI